MFQVEFDAVFQVEFDAVFQVEFDDAGTVTSWSGNPILLDRSVARGKRLLGRSRTD